MPSSVLVIGGGDPISPRELAALPRAQTVIAADSGVDRALAVGLEIDVAVGDFDSVSAQAYLRMEASGIQLLRHPANKNETDLELALLHALSLTPRTVTVAAIGGGRIDHLLAGLLLLADNRFAEVTLDALVDDHRFSVVHKQRALTGPVGSVVTLLPIGGAATGVCTDGLEYPLSNEDLDANSPRGMSNVLVAPLSSVRVETGVLFAIQELAR